MELCICIFYLVWNCCIASVFQVEKKNGIDKKYMIKVFRCRMFLQNGFAVVSIV